MRITLGFAPKGKSLAVKDRQSESIEKASKEESFIGIRTELKVEF
jgi:hypothetical protein